LRLAADAAVGQVNQLAIATFVIGTDGQVRARFVDPDYRKRMSIEDYSQRFFRRGLSIVATWMRH
jgi:hypothetical protein